MKKQTAVEWLWRWQMDNEFASFKEGVDAYKKAKQIEKQQIMDAYNTVLEYTQIDQGPEEYYNKTYQDKSAGGACEIQI
jgi:hypothetical protein